METEMVIVLVIGIVTLVVCFSYSTYQEGYERGQIDALKGIQKYSLIEFKDGTRDYYKEPKASDFDKDHEDFTIIK